MPADAFPFLSEHLANADKNGLSLGEAGWFFCNRCEHLLVNRFQMEEDTVLFVTDYRVQIAIRIRTLRVEDKVGRFSRPVNRCPVFTN